MTSCSERLVTLKKRILQYKREWTYMTVGVSCYIIGVYLLRLTGTWFKSDDTYDDSQVNGFIFGLIFLSISILLMVYVLREIYWMHYPISCIASLYVSFAIVSFFGAVLSLITFDGWVYFIGTTDDYSPVLTLISLTSFALCLLFCVMCLLLLSVTWQTRALRYQMYPSQKGRDSVSMSGEHFPLLSSSTKMIDAAEEKKTEEEEEKTDDMTPVDVNVNVNMDMSYNPSSYNSDMQCSKGDRLFFCYVLIIIPIFFLLCASLPNCYANFKSKAIFKLDNTGSGTLEKFVPIFKDYGLNLYPDLIVFYVLLFLVCTISYASRKSLWFRIEMRKNKYFLVNPCKKASTESSANANVNATGNTTDTDVDQTQTQTQAAQSQTSLPSSYLIKQGEQILYILMLLVFSFWAFYWIVVYNGYSNITKEFRWFQRVILGIGKTAMLALSFCLFPISKNTNLWNIVFNISYEHLLQYHKFFGRLFVFLSTLHLVFWLIYFLASGDFTSNIIFSSLPYSYSRTNFTVPVMYYFYVVIIVPIFVILSHEKVRHLKYEWFYFSHLFGSFICVSIVVYHANSAWYYVIPPVILYVIDQLMSMYKKCMTVAIISKIEQLANSKYIKLTAKVFKCQTQTAQNQQTIDNYFGKFCLVNIPSISKYEWHPMTIAAMNRGQCSSDNSNSNGTDNDNDNDNVDFDCDEYEFIIQKSGDWSTRVCNEINMNNINVEHRIIRLDGMYGEPIISDAYRKVLIICDGIGFVSYLAFFEKMLHRVIDEQSQISVDLVWICDSPQIYLAFAPMLRLYSNKFDADPERLFDVRVFFTKPVSEHLRNEIESEIHLTLENGLPNLMKELSYIEGLGTFTLLLANGSQLLLDQTRKVAVRFGAHYREERFQY